MRIQRYKGGKFLPISICMNPGEVRSVSLDLTGEVGVATLTGTTWTSVPEGLTISAPTQSEQTTTATVTAPDNYGNYLLKIVATTATETYNTRIPVYVAENVENS